MTRKDVLNKLRDMGISPIAQSVLSDFTEIANWAAAAERERCAKLCDPEGKVFMGKSTSEIKATYRQAMFNCAAAIRGMK